MDLEQVRADFKEGKMISKCTWALVLEACKDMEYQLTVLSAIDPKECTGEKPEDIGYNVSRVSSDCLGRVAAL